MKCLDQGVDVPEATIAIFMASTQNSQQFVQRRGRVLRKSDRTFKHQALIYDMVVCPPLDGSPTDSDKNLLSVGLSRAAELAYAAENSDQVIHKLKNYAINYGIEISSVPWLDGTKPIIDLDTNENKT